MKVSELIVVLQALSPELDVYVSDWNEDYLSPDPLEPDEVMEVEFKVEGRVVLIK